MGIWATADISNDERDASTFGGHLGNTPTDKDYLEKLTRDRLAKLGQGQQRPDLPPWLQAQQDQQKAWQQAARADQQKAFDLAQAQANGAITPQQEQLQRSYQVGNDAVLGSAQMATGGARGAAAAQGNAGQILGANQATQYAGLDAQKQADMIQGQALAAQAADALRGNDQLALNNTNAASVQNAQNQLDWRDINDQWNLWAATQGQKIDLAKMGADQFGADAALQNYLAGLRANQQAVGLGATALGAGMSAYGAYAKNNPDQPPNMYSDERVKDGFGDSAAIADRFLDALKESRATYNYTDEKYEPSSKKGSRYLGIMAQSVEKVPEIGSGIVTDRGGFKQVETLPFVSAIAGSLGRLVERVEKMEELRGKHR